MKAKSLSAFLAASILSSTPVIAQTPTDALSKIDAIPLTEMCSKDGALGKTFGATNIIEPTNYLRHVDVPLDGRFAPATIAQMGASKYSNHFFTVSYELDFGSEKAAGLAFDRLTGRIDKSTWFKLDDVLDGQAVQNTDGLAAIGGFKDAIFYNNKSILTDDGSDSRKPDDVSLSVSAMGNSLHISCENMFYGKKHMDEAFGMMPVGSPRPVFTATVVEPFLASDCDDPSKLKRRMEMVENGDLVSNAPDFARVQYEERLSDWKIMKLVSSGKITYDAITEKVIGLLDDPETMKTMEDGMALMDDMFKALEGVDENDVRAVCLAFQKFTAKSKPAIAPVAGATGDAVTPQWRLTHQMLDKEAKRLGVSFAE